MRRPRILTVIQTIGLGGGAEQLLTGLLPALKLNGIEVELVALQHWEPDLGRELEASGIPVHRLRAGDSFSLRTLATIKSVSGVRKLLKRNRYDIVWTHDRVSALVVAIASLGCEPDFVITLHSEGYVASEKMSMRMRALLSVEKYLCNSAHKVAVSKAVAESYRRSFNWREIQVVYNGVPHDAATGNITEAEKTKIRAKFGVSSREPLLIVPARYVEKKGHRYLIESLRLLKERHSFQPRVLAFGDGPLQSELRAKSVLFGVNVSWCNSIPHSELFPLIQSATAVIVPSLREPFGIAAAEAMMLGTPLVASAVDGLLELIGPNMAALVPPADAELLAAAILDIWSQPDAATSRARRAQIHIAENFTLDRAANRWASVFEQLQHQSVT